MHAFSLPPVLSNKKYHTLIAIVVIAIASVIPILSTFGKLAIGGDTFIPLVPEHSYKMAYEWMDRNNGEYFSNNYVVWISVFAGLQLLGLSIYHAAFVYQFLLFFLAGIGLYKLYNLFNTNNKLFGVIPALFFIYSPHLMDHMAYYQSTVPIIWIIYVIMKFIRYRQFSLVDAISISLLLGFISDLPNPKYHFLLFVLAILSITIAYIIKLINTKDIVSNLKYIVLIMVLSSYIVVPFVYFGYSFSRNNKVAINIKRDYQSTGETLDFGVAEVSKMMKLFHTPNINTDDYNIITNPFFSFFYNSIPLLILGLFPLIIPFIDDKRKKIYILLYCLGLFFIFLSKSSNPPFGFFYNWLLASTSLFAFMRTTAGIVIFAAIFYALMYGALTEYVTKKISKPYITIFASLFIIMMIGFPFWTGKYFRNRPNVNKYTNSSERGITIPSQYFEAAQQLAPLKLDTKINVIPINRGYQSNNWGYFGFIMYPWIFKQPTVGNGIEALPEGVSAVTNSRYVVYDKSLIANDEKLFNATESAKLLSTNDVLNVYRIPDEHVIPHLYVPRDILITNNINQNIITKEARELLAVYYMQEPPALLASLPQKIQTIPTIEYKKIDPTKYRIRIHNAKEPFPLIFTENFNAEWKLYKTNTYERTDKNRMIQQIEKTYQIFSGNEADQSTVNEVKKMIQQGFISTIGNNDSIEFISKNFKNTIQNDNLSNGRLFETWNNKNLIRDHIMVNGYANSWIINPKELCKEQYSCFNNEDGSYDFEFVAEFKPQQISYIGYTISGFVLIVTLIAWSIKKFVIKNENH